MCLPNKAAQLSYGKFPEKMWYLQKWNAKLYLRPRNKNQNKCSIQTWDRRSSTKVCAGKATCAEMCPVLNTVLR